MLNILYTVRTAILFKLRILDASIMKLWGKSFMALYMDPPEIRKIIRIWPTVELNEETAEKEL